MFGICHIFLKPGQDSCFSRSRGQPIANYGRLTAMNFY